MLDALGEPAVVRPLLRLWEDPTPAPPVTPGEWLASLLNDADPWLRACAALAATEVQDARLAGMLAQMAESDPEPWVRECAWIALEGGESMKTLPTLSLMERILFLRRVPLFSSLPATDLKQIAAVMGESLFTNGETIVTEGEPGDEMFIIVSGEVRVLMAAQDGSDKEIVRRKPGEVVGEMAIISQEPRMATLVAAGEVRTLSIDRRQFEGILRMRPDTSLAVMRVLIQRIRERSA
jgi:hypothetical protein